MLIEKQRLPEIVLWFSGLLVIAAMSHVLYGSFALSKFLVGVVNDSPVSKMNAISAVIGIAGGILLLAGCVQLKKSPTVRVRFGIGAAAMITKGIIDALRHLGDAGSTNMDVKLSTLVTIDVIQIIAWSFILWIIPFMLGHMADVEKRDDIPKLMGTQ